MEKWDFMSLIIFIFTVTKIYFLIPWNDFPINYVNNLYKEGNQINVSNIESCRFITIFFLQPDKVLTETTLCLQHHRLILFWKDIIEWNYTLEICINGGWRRP